MTAAPALLDVNVLAPRSALRPLPSSQRAYKPGLAATLLGLGDLCGVSCALFGSVLVRHCAGGDFELSLYFRLFPVLGLFTVAYALFGLYPGVTCNPVAEIRRAAAATTAVFLTLATLTLLFRVVEVYSRVVFLMAWLLALVGVPLTRAAVRSLFARKSWWGYPLVIFGAGSMVRDLVRSLREQPQLGLRTVAIVDRGYPAGTMIEGVPVIRRVEDAPVARGGLAISRGVVATSGISREDLSEVLNSRDTCLPHLLIAPGLEGVSSLETEATDICRLLMLETRNRLLMPGPRLTKRALDLACAAALAILVFPLALIVGVLIKLESRGPVLSPLPPRTGWPAYCDMEIPYDGCQCGPRAGPISAGPSGDGRRVAAGSQAETRPARDPPGPFPAAHQPRRIAAAFERLMRRHELGGAAANRDR